MNVNTKYINAARVKDLYSGNVKAYLKNRLKYEKFHVVLIAIV